MYRLQKAEEARVNFQICKDVQVVKNRAKVVKNRAKVVKKRAKVVKNRAKVVTEKSRNPRIYVS